MAASKRRARQSDGKPGKAVTIEPSWGFRRCGIPEASPRKPIASR